MIVSDHNPTARSCSPDRFLFFKRLPSGRAGPIAA
jgi:hypothetical protein